MYNTVNNGFTQKNKTVLLFKVANQLCCAVPKEANWIHSHILAAVHLLLQK